MPMAAAWPTRYTRGHREEAAAKGTRGHRKAGILVLESGDMGDKDCQENKMWQNAHDSYLESRILSADPIELVHLLKAIS